MTRAEDQTREKIVLSALALFSERGIGKTTVGEVAFHAGVTRVTVYRYFAEKKELVRAAHLRVEQVFQKALADLEQNPLADWESVLNQIGEDLSALPVGDVSARSDELKRLYPAVYNAIQEVRVATLNGIFDHLSAMAEFQGVLRPGLNRSIVQAVFWELVINFFDNPRFKSFGLSDAELYHAMTDILLYGVLGSRPTRTKTAVRR
jgi:AcrR family transcriptional regulator